MSQQRRILHKKRTLTHQAVRVFSLQYHRHMCGQTLDNKSLQRTPTSSMDVHISSSRRSEFPTIRSITIIGAQSTLDPSANIFEAQFAKKCIESALPDRRRGEEAMRGRITRYTKGSSLRATSNPVLCRWFGSGGSTL